MRPSTGIPAGDYTLLSSASEWVGDPGQGRDWVDDLLTHVHELREYFNASSSASWCS